MDGRATAFGGCRLAFACVWSVVVLATTSRMATADENVTIEVSGCEMDSGEIGRLVRLELGAVIDPRDRVEGYRVAVTCRAEGIELRIEDPLTQKALEREVSPPKPDLPEPERLVALSLAQLYRSAWLELVADDPPPLPLREPPPEAAQSRQAARSSVQAVLPDTSRTGPTRASLHLGFSIRGVAYEPVWMPSAGLRYGWRPTDAWWLEAGGRFEAGSDTRSTGRVEARVAGLRARIAFEPTLSGGWHGILDAEGGPAFLSLRGRDVAPGLSEGTIEGMVLDASVGSGLSYETPRVRLALSVHAGATLGAPVGFVQDDRPMDMNGAWLGADIVAGLRF